MKAQITLQMDAPEAAIVASFLPAPAILATDAEKVGANARAQILEALGIDEVDAEAVLRHFINSYKA